jgi:hypothetical protein
MSQRGFGSLLVIIIVILIISAGIAAYFFKAQSKNASEPSTATEAKFENTSGPAPDVSHFTGPTPTINPKFVCQDDSDCKIDSKECIAVSKSSNLDSAQAESCNGKVVCMYGACAIQK